ncbi:MAG: type VI secretion system tip protein VgrG [Oceanospirillaceae bacterium]|nr:type VI secretion system tip protein VgrG [Oceanospirillaceae bacterium]
MPTRQISITTPLAEEELLLVEMNGQERLGRLYNYDLLLHSPNEALDVDTILGQKVTVNLELADGEYRYFNGYISQFSQVDRSEGGHAVYRAQMTPWLWFLTLTSDCRIFQEMSVPDIIKEVFNDNGFSDYQINLDAIYTPLEYCVQYRETDFNFISRLMEQEGIYYYFTHEEGEHTLILCDSATHHSNILGESVLPYHLSGVDQSVEVEHIADWQKHYQIKSGVYALADYNFKTPQNKLLVNRIIQRGHDQAEAEIFDYPGEYVDAGQGENYALQRIEELHTGFAQINANTDARQMITGCLFKLKEHPREDQNREYLIIAAHYQLRSDSYSSGGAAQGDTYQCHFEAIESATSFRSARSTAKPIVAGSQTAVVVGPAGEEIYPDEYGRVKVQFHWDRYGGNDENSSCWVRVQQLWAGAQWGAQFIPRIGHEVIVEFLEGDPDRPIITGRVYNADNMPTYSLPDNKTQSGIKSRSSTGGSAANFNEIRMEDKKGSEELYFQAEKDQNILVKNNKTEQVGVNETVTIGNDQSLDVGNDQSSTIGNDQTEDVVNNRTETVGADETLSVAVNRSRSVGANEDISVGANRSHTVQGSEKINVAVAQNIMIGGLQGIEIGATQSTNIGAKQSINVGASQSVNIGSDHSLNIGAGQTKKIGADQALTIGKNRTSSIGENDSLTVGKDLVIEAGDSITIKCGKAVISMKKDGTININGKDISLKAKGKINAKASKNIVMKGKKILQN